MHNSLSRLLSTVPVSSTCSVLCAKSEAEIKGANVLRCSLSISEMLWIRNNAPKTKLLNVANTPINILLCTFILGGGSFYGLDWALSFSDLNATVYRDVLDWWRLVSVLKDTSLVCKAQVPVWCGWSWLDRIELWPQLNPTTQKERRLL